MTLDTLQAIRRQLLDQREKLPSMTDPAKPVLMHCNYIELSGAIQLIDQLITQEQFTLAQPPGATGPQL